MPWILDPANRAAAATNAIITGISGAGPDPVSFRRKSYHHGNPIKEPFRVDPRFFNRSNGYLYWYCRSCPFYCVFSIAFGNRPVMDCEFLRKYVNDRPGHPMRHSARRFPDKAMFRANTLREEERSYMPEMQALFAHTGLPASTLYHTGHGHLPGHIFDRKGRGCNKLTMYHCRVPDQPRISIHPFPFILLGPSRHQRSGVQDDWSVSNSTNAGGTGIRDESNVFQL